MTCCSVEIHLKFSNAGESGLGRWVSAQRLRHKVEKLANERIRRLQEMGFLWEARPLTGDLAIENTKCACETVDVSDQDIRQETVEISESDGCFPQHIVSDQGIKQETVSARGMTA
jgi:Helicase associated domain